MAKAGELIFEDFTGEVNEQIEGILIKWLEEASSELASQAATRTGTGAYYREIASRWTNLVDKDKFEAYVGNPLEDAIWAEYGTGEYALNGDGRKGYWVFVKDSAGVSKSTKQYTLEEAKATVAFMRANGLDAVYTCGNPPKRCLHLAFLNNEKMLKDHLRDELKGME